MIVVDTSALLAILFDEPRGPECADALAAAAEVRISAGTLAEMLIILAHRGGSAEALALIQELGIHVEPVTAATAERLGEAHGRWGKGAHAAALNFGDCFAYALARELDCPLLFIGKDFALTDLQPALA